MPLRINTEKSSILSPQTIQIAIDGDTREELDSQMARDTALTYAGQHGFGNAGLSEAPLIGTIDTETNEIMDGAEALDPNRQRQGWRGLFKINKRL